MDKDVNTYSGILFSHKKDEIVPFAITRMDLEYIKLSEINQGKKIYDFTQNLRKRISEKNVEGKKTLKTRLLNVENKLVVAKERLVGGWVK